MYRYRRIAQASLAASAAALYIDENSLLQPWRWVTHTLHMPGAGKTPNALQVHVRVKAKPPPIGCTEWPAGRVLLQWAVNEVPPTGATVLEFGAGVGVTALGLALRSGKGIEEQEKECPTRIVATDICEASLENLRANAAANGIAVCSVALDSSSPQSHASLTVGVWDAVGGNKALERLRDDIGIDPCALTHVIGGDIMYHGFDSMAAEASQGLVSTLAALLHANPQINVTLLLVDRFSGSTVAAVSQVLLLCAPCMLSITMESTLLP